MRTVPVIHTETQRISIAEMTPPPSGFGDYAAEIVKIDVDFQDLPMISWGIEAYDIEDFNKESEKYKLIEYLSRHGFYTEVHLNGKALDNVIGAKKMEDSEIADALASIEKLDRVIFNLNSSYCSGKKNTPDKKPFDPATPSDLGYFMQHRDFGKYPVNKKHKSIVLLHNPATSEVVKGALQHHAMVDGMNRLDYELGVMFCPEKPTEDAYKEFKPCSQYNLP